MSSLLEVKGLNVGIRTGGRWSPILRDVSLSVERAETVTIVGETGSGKTLTAKAIMGLLPKNVVVESGSITFDGTDMLSKDGALLGRRRVAMKMASSSARELPILVCKLSK